MVRHGSDHSSSVTSSHVSDYSSFHFESRVRSLIRCHFESRVGPFIRCHFESRVRSLIRCHFESRVRSFILSLQVACQITRHMSASSQMSPIRCRSESCVGSIVRRHFNGQSVYQTSCMTLITTSEDRIQSSQVRLFLWAVVLLVKRLMLSYRAV